jgi:hypothetical protein
LDVAAQGPTLPFGAAIRTCNEPCVVVQSDHGSILVVGEYHLSNGRVSEVVTEPLQKRVRNLMREQYPPQDIATFLTATGFTASIPEATSLISAVRGSNRIGLWFLVAVALFLLVYLLSR